MEGVFIGWVGGMATCLLASLIRHAWYEAVERASKQIEIARISAEWEAEKQ